MNVSGKFFLTFGEEAVVGLSFSGVGGGGGGAGAGGPGSPGAPSLSIGPSGPKTIHEK